jgi:hypothetical protein
MQAVLRSALEVYRRKRFLDEMNRSYAELRRDHQGWNAWTAERDLWDRTLMDGLVAEAKVRYGAGRPRRRKRR